VKQARSRSGGKWRGRVVSCIRRGRTSGGKAPTLPANSSGQSASSVEYLLAWCATMAIPPGKIASGGSLPGLCYFKVLNAWFNRTGGDVSAQ
jgi:hypothetical protein